MNFSNDIEIEIEELMLHGFEQKDKFNISFFLEKELTKLFKNNIIDFNDPIEKGDNSHIIPLPPPPISTSSNFMDENDVSYETTDDAVVSISTTNIAQRNNKAVAKQIAFSIFSHVNNNYSSTTNKKIK